MTTSTRRTGYIAGLRALADALERDENIPLPLDGISSPFAIYVHGLDGEKFAAVVASLRGTGWQQRIKQGSEVTWLEVRGQLAGLRVEVNAQAGEVCEPIPPQPVIKRTCPALDAVIAQAGSETS